jgi:hypothetical protein
MEVNAAGIHVRNFADIQPEALQDDLGVHDESARAKLRARITRLFQDQDAGGYVREVLGKMEGGGESRGSTANDDNVTLEHIP